MIPGSPFAPGSHVSIAGRGFHRVVACEAIDGGGWRLQLEDRGRRRDDWAPFAVEVWVHRGTWRTEDLEAVEVAAEAPDAGQMELFA